MTEHKNLLIVDAEGAILGRLSSFVAKQSLLGKNVIVVNCSEAIISGERRMVIKRYQIERGRGGSSLKGPHFPKDPERIVKRTITRMLSYTQGRGRAASKRVICHNDIPIEYKDVPKIKAGRSKPIKSIKLSELEREL